MCTAGPFRSSKLLSSTSSSHQYSALIIDFNLSTETRGVKTALNGKGWMLAVCVNACVSIGFEGSSDILKAHRIKAVFMNTDLNFISNVTIRVDIRPVCDLYSWTNSIERGLQRVYEILPSYLPAAKSETEIPQIVTNGAIGTYPSLRFEQLWILKYVCRSEDRPMTTDDGGTGWNAIITL